jgi:hypothetical protein
MRRLVLGTLATLWGAAIVGRAFLGHSAAAGSGAYAGGAKAAVIFGALLLVFGARAVVLALRAR